MLKRRWFPAITAGLLVLTTVLSVFFMRVSTDAVAVGNHFDYETILFDPDQIMQIDITVDSDKWNEMLSNAQAEEYIDCDVTIHGKKISTVGIRPKGNTSLTQVANSDSDRYSFKLEFDHYIEGQNCYGLDKLVLNNIISDNSYRKEYLSYDLLSFMEIPASLYCYAKISVNGENWGIYLALEAMEESFLQRNYGSDYGMLYKPESDEIVGGAPDGGDKSLPKREETFPVIQENSFGEEQPGEKPSLPADSDQVEFLEEFSPNGEGQKEMQQFKENFGKDSGGSGADLVYTDNQLESYASIFDHEVTEGEQADYERVISALQQLSEGEDLDEVIDVDEVLRYFAVNTVLVNLDSYVSNMKHNYYLYEQNGQLQMLPWDYNLAFAGFQSGSASDAVNFPIDTPISGTTMEQTPMLAKLLEVEEYQEQYHNYLRQIVEEYFNSGYFETVLAKLSLLLDEEVSKDPTAFCSYEEYQQAVVMLEKFALLRAQSIEGQLDGEIPSTDYGQQEYPEKLLDSSDIELSVMGMQGGNHSDFDGENRGDRTFMTQEVERPAMAEFGEQPTAMEEIPQMGGKMQESPPETTTISSEQIVLVTISGILWLGGFLFVICFPKRRWIFSKKADR